MRRVPTLAAFSALPLLVVPLTTVTAADARPDPGAVGDAAGVVSRAAPMAALTAEPGTGEPSFVAPPDAGATSLRVPAATIRVTYQGITRPARRAFQRAVNIWEPLLASSVPITVRATFAPAGRGNLGSAGPSRLYRGFRGAPKPGTWYVDAIANKRAGRNLHKSPDIVARFNSNRSDWYFRTDGDTPSNRYDFTSVALHELGHGLGFLGAGRVGGTGRGTVRLSGSPLGYDRLTESGAGARLLSFANGSTRLGDQLRSNNVWFDSPQVRSASGGNRARLYAPATFQPGSSYSHLNEATYRRRNPNSLMTPFLGGGEAIHNPGPITRAVFSSIGW